MRIALLSDGIPPYVIGGMQKHSFMLVEFLARAGIHVELFHLVDGPELPSDEDVLSHFSEQSRRFINPHTFQYEDRNSLPGHYLRAQWKISSAYFEVLKPIENLDFILIKGFVGKTILKQRHELRSNCKIGVKFHGMNMFQKQPDFKSELTKFILRPAVKWSMKHADYVFSYGGRISDLIANTGVDKQRIVEISSGISEDWISERPSENNSPRVLLFVGRYDRVKGLPELYLALDAFDDSEILLHAVGPIPEEQQIQKAGVTYLGSIIDPDQLKAEYDKADALVCPSISEGMPNVILEAMSRGLFVISSDVGATPLLIQNNGVLTRPGDVTDLASGLRHFLDLSEMELSEAKHSSIQHAQNFTWERIVDQFIDFFASRIDEN